MNLWSFVAGPFLWCTLLIVILGIVARITLFSYAIVTSGKNRALRGVYLFVILGRFLLPFHRAAAKRPLYAASRYLFHVCLIVAPLWASGHIILLQASRFGWYWTPFSDVWTDWLTVLVLIFAILFILRRVIVPDIRLSSSKADYFLITIVALPFLTGYIAYHQWLDYPTILILHGLSGEAALIALVILFCRANLDPIKCTGCAACTLICPTETLEATDREQLRIFSYSHYQCISCGACTATCPEGAAALKHEMSLKRLFQILPKEEIRSVELSECERCGCFFAPTPQVERVGQLVADGEREIPALQYCDKCRRRVILDQTNPMKRLDKAPVSKEAIRLGRQ